MDWRDIALVAVGGALGSVGRFALSSWLPTREFPWATLLVNIVGCFALGALLLPSGMEHGARLFVAVGVLGGFTTLSTFGAETVDLARSGHAALSAVNLIANGVGGPLAAWLGWRVALAAGASPAV